jgi:hypothetical protein
MARRRGRGGVLVEGRAPCRGPGGVDDSKQSGPGVDEPEGEEEVRGRRGCQGEPRRGAYVAAAWQSSASAEGLQSQGGI